MTTSGTPTAHPLGLDEPIHNWQVDYEKGVDSVTHPDDDYAVRLHLNA